MFFHMQQESKNLPKMAPASERFVGGTQRSTSLEPPKNEDNEVFSTAESLSGQIKRFIVLRDEYQTDTYSTLLESRYQRYHLDI